MSRIESLSNQLTELSIEQVVYKFRADGSAPVIDYIASTGRVCPTDLRIETLNKSGWHEEMVEFFDALQDKEHSLIMSRIAHAEQEAPYYFISFDPATRKMTESYSSFDIASKNSGQIGNELFALKELGVDRIEAYFISDSLEGPRFGGEVFVDPRKGVSQTDLSKAKDIGEQLGERLLHELTGAPYDLHGDFNLSLDVNSGEMDVKHIRSKIDISPTIKTVKEENLPSLTQADKKQLNKLVNILDGRRINISYFGQGDDGEVKNVYFVDADEMDSKTVNLASAITLTALDATFPDWQSGDGSVGDVLLNPTMRSLTFEHIDLTRHNEVEVFTEKLTVLTPLEIRDSDLPTCTTSFSLSPSF